MKLPLSFSLNSLLKILLPGFILSLSFLPWTIWVLTSLGYRETVIYAFPVLVIFFGWFLVIADMHVYMLYEGRRYWPTWLWQFFLNKEKNLLKAGTERLEKYHEEFKKTGNPVAENIYLEMSVFIRQFPIDKHNGERVCKYPTRLGNILNMYETYSEIMYGLDGVFYWYRLWILLDKDVRDDFESKSAYADSTIYTSAALFISSLVVLSYMFFGVFCLGVIDNLSFYVWPIASAILLVFGYFIYRASLHLHTQFGETWKSIFDVYRTKLAAIQVEDEIVAWTRDPNIMKRMAPRQKNSMTWSYLQYYKIWCEKKGRSFLAPQYFQECNRVEIDEDQA